MLEQMIQVLASLVAAINENTKAIREASSVTNVVALPGAAKAPVAQPEAEPQQEKKQPKKPKEEKKPEPAAEEARAEVVPSVNDVRAAAQALMDANGQDAAPLIELNTKFGSKRISEVPEGKRAEVIAELNRLIEKAKGAGAI